MAAVYAQIYALLLLASAVVAGALSVYAWRRRATPGRVTFSLLMAMVAEWAACGAVESLVVGVPAKILVSKISYLGISTVAPLWLLFALKYSGRRTPLTPRWMAALWTIPAITILLAATNEWHGWIWPYVGPASPIPGAPVVYDHGWGVWLIAGYSYLLVLIGSGCLVRATLRSAGIYRRQTAAAVGAAAMPVLANVLYLAGGRTFAGLDPSPVAFALTGLLVAEALFRHGMLDLVPVARGFLVEHMGDAVVVLDEQGRVVDANPAAARMLPGFVVGASVTDLGERWGEIFRRCQETSGGHHEVELDAESGKRWLETHCSPITDRRGRVTGWLGVVRDITERKRAEEDRLEFERRLQRTQRLQSLGVLAGGVAHDFNNILAGVLGNVELALMRLPEDDPNGPLLQKASAGTLRAAELTKQMLSYAGKGIFVTQRLDLVGLVAGMAELLADVVPKSVRIDLDLPHEPLHVKGDDGQLRQVVVNLVTNAGEAIGDGPGRVSLRVRRVEAGRALLDGAVLGDALPEGAYVELNVSDDGCGMDAETQAKLFDPFFTTKFLGRGLGMAAVHGIVSGHRGAIRVESRPGAGTAIGILLPEATVPLSQAAS